MGINTEIEFLPSVHGVVTFQGLFYYCSPPPLPRKALSPGIFFLSSFNDSDLHLAFDLAALGTGAWCLGKAGEVSTCCRCR